MIKYCRIIGVVACLGWLGHAQAADLAIEDFVLDNGLQVVVVENHKAPIVKQMLFYKTGAVDEQPGQGGTAHLLEHLMFRGTAQIKGKEFNRILEENGAESNAFTSQDVTAYHQFADISRLELAMFLEADRMNGLKISDEDFKTERQIVFQERKQRIDNNPVARFFEYVRKALWAEHPYGNPVTGQEREILGLKKQDAQDFYRRYYAPNNAVLVLAGDIDMTTAKQLAQKYYGQMKSVDLPKTTFPYLPQNYKTKVEMSLPEVRMGRLVKMFAAPSFNYQPQKIYALDVLKEYLSGDENSPMYQKLVVKDKTALAVDISYDAVVRSYGLFVVSVVPAEKHGKAFEKSIETGWNYALNTLTEAKLERVKQKMLADLVYLSDNAAALAQTAGYVAAVGGKLDDLRRYATHIQKVTLSEVKEVAKDLWNNAPQVVGVLYPDGEKNE